eukprot:6474589-Amphidinium_carterae.1
MELSCKQFAVLTALNSKIANVKPMRGTYEAHAANGGRSLCTLSYKLTLCALRCGLKMKLTI